VIPSDAATAWGHGGIKERFRIVVDELTAWPAGGEAFWVALVSACVVPKLASCLQITDFLGGHRILAPHKVKMSRTRKLVIALLAGMALAVSFAPAGSADPTCQPGQNANPQPGFKPGGCK